MVALTGALLAVGLGVPASAVPPSLGLGVESAGADTDSPFLGEEVLVQSTPMSTPGGRASWTCQVDFGDGATGGYWRAQPSSTTAPCAAFHTYEVAGSYLVVMTVTDAEGGHVSEQRQVTVTARPVASRAAGLEGAAATLAGPGGPDPVRWSLADPGAADVCDLGPSPAPSTTVTCHDEGTYRVHYDTGDAATSGGYDVTWVNGAPDPKMRAKRTMLNKKGDPYFLPVRRVGTGDQVRFDVTARDPSTSGTKGDELTCAYRHGNGLREEQVAYVVDGTCNGQTSYLAPGRRTSRVRVTDGDGGSGKARATVVVVRRDVHLRVRDVRRGGTRGVITASLTPRGLSGRLALRFPNGQSLVATRLTSIQVTSFGSVSLLGHAKVNGKPGYRFVAFPDTGYPQGIAFSVRAWRVGRPEKDVVQQTVYRNDFRVRLHAPPVG